MPLPESTRNFIQEHLDDNIHRLLLSAHRYPGIDVPAAVVQIEALRKVRLKVPSWYRFDLEFPALVSVEQASSEQAARFKAGLFSGRSMADLTGGMGVDAYFFAQHFDRVTYLERRPELVALARHNFDVLGARNINTVEADAEIFLECSNELFDLIYLDPARRDDRRQRVFQLADCQPNVVVLKKRLLAVASQVLVKTAPLLDLKSAMEQLRPVSQVWVVAVGDEVKEVLYLLDAQTGQPDDEAPVSAVLLDGYPAKPPEVFRFTHAEEQSARPVYSPVQQYLYEPPAAILKAGAFNVFAMRYGLAKLHPNTHLYTSAAPVEKTPGRRFRIAATVRYDRKALQTVLPGAQAHVAVRNFPDTADGMRKRLGLKDGGDWYVFGVRDTEGLKVVVGEKT